jgi:regulator of PEP synthase PpsR (kinase-PPPase family)
MELLQGQIGQRAREKRAAQHVMDADYFRRIDAMHYVLAHDDGQGAAGISEADVVLVGVSRSSKTPTCFYLANRGIKAANVPIVPGATLPVELVDPPCPVVGLHIETNALIEIRRHRLRIIGAHGVRQDTTDYVDHESVKAEILASRRLCTAHGWPMIDVTRRSIEETAATVLQLMEAWHTRRGKAVAAEAAAAADPAAAVLGGGTGTGTGTPGA